MLKTRVRKGVMENLSKLLLVSNYTGRGDAPASTQPPTFSRPDSPDDSALCAGVHTQQSLQALLREAIFPEESPFITLPP